MFWQRQYLPFWRYYCPKVGRYCDPPSGAQWFHDNYLKANSDKSHVMLTTDNKLKINVKGSPISNEKTVKLLGVTVDNKFSFEPHLNLVCKKVSQKLHALARVSKFISKKKLRVIMKAFIMSHFSYCPLV